MSNELETLRAIAPDPERMLAVRRSVLARIAEELQPNWPLRLAWAFGLAAMATGVLSLWPTPKRLDLAAVEWPTVVIQPPDFAFDLTPPPRPLPPPVAPPPKAEIEVVGATDDGIQLQLPSTDPDVIVYYFVDDSGE